MLRQFSSRLMVSTYVRRAVQIEFNAKQFRSPLSASCLELIPIRHKYVTSGVQGRRNSKTAPKKFVAEDDEFENEEECEDKVALKER